MTMPERAPSAWRDVAGLDELDDVGRKVVRIGSRQIALFRSADGRILACNNRCPHEGYPLSEGHLGGDNGCTLTCNWHNWKFDLESGETLVGGDRVRRYPVRVAKGRIVLDLADPPAAETVEAALDGLVAGLERHEYDRFAREIARMAKAGADPLQALRRTIAETADRFEFGASHALPASADWLELRAEAGGDPVRSLAMLTECVGHFAWDSRREPRHPFPDGIARWDEKAFVAAIEREDEAAAAALVRGAVADGLGWAAMEPGFARAALAHYADFGHSAIYTYKMRALTARLGDRESLLNLALMLARSLVYQTREDLIPEFRAYGATLAAWDGRGENLPPAEELRRGSVSQVLARLAEGSAEPEALFEAAFAAAAWQFLHFDTAWQAKTDSTVGQNVGWLDFTHALTFANAARKLAEACPALWPNAILQLGCFLGRNAGFTDAALDESEWCPADPAAAVNGILRGIEDHGQGEYIVACHLLKTAFAIREELRDRPGAAAHTLSVGAFRRLVASPLKRRHTLRTARQALDFVAREA